VKRLSWALCEAVKRRGRRLIVDFPIMELHFFVERGFVTVPIAQESEAFESAVSRLPYPVFVVDSENRLRPMNSHAKHLWDEEGLDELQLVRSPSHPLSRLIVRVRGGEGEDEETTVLQLSKGARYEVIHSTPSLKGETRWLMVMLRPFPTGLTVDQSALRERWSLTPREAEVAAACIAGRTTGEICEALAISRETVKTHVARVLDKANCQNRSQLITTYLFGE